MTKTSHPPPDSLKYTLGPPLLTLSLPKLYFRVKIQGNREVERCLDSLIKECRADEADRGCSGSGCIRFKIKKHFSRHKEKQALLSYNYLQILNRVVKGILLFQGFPRPNLPSKHPKHSKGYIFKKVVLQHSSKKCTNFFKKTLQRRSLFYLTVPRDIK